jgi:hypothetical protein
MAGVGVQFSVIKWRPLLRWLGASFTFRGLWR